MSAEPVFEYRTRSSVTQELLDKGYLRDLRTDTFVAPDGTSWKINDSSHIVERYYPPQPADVSKVVGERRVRLDRPDVNTAPTTAPSKLDGHDVDPIVDYDAIDKSAKLTNPKDLVGSNKLHLHLFPQSAVALGSLAFLEGALKYGRSNWREAGVRASIYVDALNRHMTRWFEGEDIDPDSGIPHLGKALACIAILIDAGYAGKLEDDRMAPGGTIKAIEQLTPIVEELKKRYGHINPKHYTIKDATCVAKDTPSK